MNFKKINLNEIQISLFLNGFLCFFTVVLTLISPLASAGGGEVRLGIMGFTLPAPNQPILGESVRTLEEAFRNIGLKVSYIPFDDLKDEACNGKVDLLITSAGMYRQLQSCGVRDLANVISDRYPNPNRGEGAAFIVLKSSSIQNISDLKGKVAAVNSLRAFPGFQIPMHEIHKRGFNPEKFFSKIIPLGGRDYSRKALEKLREGKVDVVLLKQCQLELYVSKFPKARDEFRVLENRASEQQCARSTDLYPTWTISTTKGVNPEISRVATLALLSMKAVSSGYRWAVATDYGSVDSLLKDLMLGPYSYLREKTLKRFIEDYWPFLAIFILSVFSLALHSWRTEVVVRKRTTEVKELLEEKIRLREAANFASNRLERLQKIGVVNQICSILAHECGQPIATISVYCELLKNMVQDRNTDSSKIFSILTNVEKENQKVFKIVDKVRKYRKEKKCQLKTVNLSKVVQDAENSFKEANLDSSVLVVSRIQEKLYSQADSLEVELIVVNLLKNAVEASENLYREVYLDFFNQDQRNVLVVSNMGKGLSDKELDNIRNEKIETVKEHGLGLGLSIVKGVVERHKARLNFDRNSGGGLTVTVSFKEDKNADVRD